MIKIYPSIISGDILNIAQQIKILEPYCDGFHLDVMDFHFVQNLTFGPMFINEIAKICSKQLFVHLMVDDPLKWIDVLKLRDNDIFSFHYEATNDPKKIIEEILKKNWIASIAINPNTKIDSIFPLLDRLDQVLIMSVNPGFSGQEFISESIGKIEKLNEYKASKNLEFSIAIDGGVNQNNIAMLAKKGVTDFAISSAIFKNENPINAIEQLYRLAS